MHHRDIDHKAKLKPIEKNYILNPLVILQKILLILISQNQPMLKEKEKAIAASLAFKQDLILHVTIYHSFTGKKSQVNYFIYLSVKVSRNLLSWDHKSFLH